MGASKIDVSKRRVNVEGKGSAGGGKEANVVGIVQTRRKLDGKCSGTKEGMMAGKCYRERQGYTKKRKRHPTFFVDPQRGWDTNTK